MQVLITGRHFEVTDAIRGYVEKKVVKFNRFAPKILEVHIFLSVEKYRHIAEITLLAKHYKISNKVTTGDMYSAIDKAVDKVAARLKRHIEKLSEHKLRHPVELTAIE